MLVAKKLKIVRLLKILNYYNFLNFCLFFKKYLFYTLEKIMNFFHHLRHNISAVFNNSCKKIGCSISCATVCFTNIAKLCSNVFKCPASQQDDDIEIDRIDLKKHKITTAISLGILTERNGIEYILEVNPELIFDNIRSAFHNAKCSNNSLHNVLSVLNSICQDYIKDHNLILFPKGNSEYLRMVNYNGYPENVKVLRSNNSNPTSQSLVYSFLASYEGSLINVIDIGFSENCRYTEDVYKAFHYVAENNLYSDDMCYNFCINCMYISCCCCVCNNAHLSSRQLKAATVVYNELQNEQNSEKRLNQEGNREAYYDETVSQDIVTAGLAYHVSKGNSITVIAPNVREEVDYFAKNVVSVSHKPTLNALATHTMISQAMKDRSIGKEMHLDSFSLDNVNLYGYTKNNIIGVFPVNVT
ncbi:hypothetical protein AB837_00241 [bacterium AB1]|nr:hypothetical protein AB837_00241 [bacterium AB1]